MDYATYSPKVTKEVNFRQQNLKQKSFQILPEKTKHEDNQIIPRSSKVNKYIWEFILLVP